MLHMDDSGIAYGFFMALVFLIFCGFILALLSPAVNGLVSAHNTYVNQGEVSVQTQQAVAWNVGAFVLCPVIALIGIFFWAVVRANQQKTYGGQ